MVYKKEELEFNNNKKSNIALKRGAERSKDLQIRVRETLKIIEEEININNGVYPHKNGALSLAEIARRARVHPTTFYSPNQRDFGIEVTKWLEKIRFKSTANGTSVRRDLASRVADWRKLFENLQRAQRTIELELQQLEANSRLEIEKRDYEIDRLRRLLEATNKVKILRN